MDPETQKAIATAIEKIDALGTGLAAERKRLDEFKTQLGDRPMSEAVDEITTELATQFVKLADAEAFQKRIDEIEKKYERAREAADEAKMDVDEHRKSFHDLLRSGCGKEREIDVKTKEFMDGETYRLYVAKLHKPFGTELEIKTLMESVSTAGGLFVPAEVEKEILKNYVAVDPIRSIASVRSTSSNRIEGFRRTGTPTAEWVTELGTASDSESAWHEYEVPIHNMAIQTPVSRNMLDDARFIEGEIAADTGEQFSYKEGIAFLEGDGVGKAMGLLNRIDEDNDLYPASVASGSTDVISADDFSALYTALAVVYRAGSTWGFNSASLKKILQLKEATTNAFIWQPGLQAGPPAQIYGRPFIICENMDNEGGDVYPIFLGDISRAYRIYDRQATQLLLDVYTAYPKVYFKFHRRLGGQVIKPEAVKILKTT